MFHLLVAHGGWDERGGNLSKSRVYIRNDVEHEQPFLKSDGRRPFMSGSSKQKFVV